MHRPCVATTSHQRVDHALLLQIARERGGEEKRILRDDRRVSVMCESSGVEVGVVMVVVVLSVLLVLY